MLMDQQQFIEDLFEKGVLVNKELVEKGINSELLLKVEAEGDLIVLNSDYMDIISQQTSLVDWYEVDSQRVDAEKGSDELYQNHLQHFKKATLALQTPQFNQQQDITGLETSITNSVQSSSNFQTENNTNTVLDNNLTAPAPPFVGSYKVCIVVSHSNVAKKYEIKDFTNFFLSRYRFLEGILRHRTELEGVSAISRVLGKKEKEKVSIIGLIEEIALSKNGNLMITLEDPTGKIKLMVSKNKKDLWDAAKDLVNDEVIGASGMSGDKIIFADNIVWPEVPSDHGLKKGEIEEYVIFLSDIHVGSTLFLKEEFERFISWIRGEAGSDTQKELAAKVKYIIIAGDLVDGIGIYPSQEVELEIKDIKKQYEEFARLIKQIPVEKHIVMCPGNHDVVHLAEPQTAFYKEYSAALFEMPNVTLVSNPAMVNIGKTETFSGFDVLLYHGYSFDYYVSNVESIRNQGGYHRADLLMKFLLKRRHLAPSFKSTPYFPAHHEDPLLITKIPDFFVTGHIHYSKVANYKGITLLSGSCWQGKTSFQEKMGHEPEPARVPLVNLKTREVKVLKFI